jgi:hypothetical protein
METIEDIVLSLNDLLEAEQFDPELLDDLITSLNELCNSQIMLNYELLESLDTSFNSKIIFFDFEFYNEKRLFRARYKKRRAIKAQNFELAANAMDLEKECLKYISFKKQCGFEKSIFVIVRNFLIYAYFGNDKNDQLIKEFLNQEKGFKNLKIDYLLYCLKS